MSFRSMKIPLGRPNCFHSARNLPSWSKIWMRLLPRSPTNTLPVESIAIAWSSVNSPGAEPFFPHALINLPSFENLTIRALESPPCPSATKISPLGEVTTAEGRLNVSWLSPATPAFPRASKTFPSGLNLTTWWPLPSFPSASVTHTLPSLSTCMPWGNTNKPAPNHFTALPDRSNLKIGARFDSAQLRSPHLSKTQMLPSRSTSTADVDPHFLPSGYFAQPSSTRYGLSCVYADGNIETIAAMRVNIGHKSRITMTSLGVTNRGDALLRNQPGGEP